MTSGADFVSITSFNEWGEGTQIEAVRRHEDPTTGAAFADYGDDDAFKYMHLTADGAARFQAQLVGRAQAAGGWSGEGSAGSGEGGAGSGEGAGRDEL